MRKFLIAVAAFVIATGAFAVEVAGVKIDDKASVAGQELVLNGAGMRTKVFLKIYIGSLYLPAKAGDLSGVLAKGPRRIQLNVMRSLTRRSTGRCAGRWLEGEQFGRRARCREVANGRAGRDDEGVQ